MLVASRHRGIGSLHVPVAILPHEENTNSDTRSSQMRLSIYVIVAALLIAAAITWLQSQLNMPTPGGLARSAGSDLQGPTITHLINVAQQLFVRAAQLTR